MTSCSSRQHIVALRQRLRTNRHCALQLHACLQAEVEAVAACAFEAATALTVAQHRADASSQAAPDQSARESLPWMPRHLACQHVLQRRAIRPSTNDAANTPAQRQPKPDGLRSPSPTNSALTPPVPKRTPTRTSSNTTAHRTSAKEWDFGGVDESPVTPQTASASRGADTCNGGTRSDAAQAGHVSTRPRRCRIAGA